MQHVITYNEQHMDSFDDKSSSMDDKRKNMTTQKVKTITINVDCSDSSRNIPANSKR